MSTRTPPPAKLPKLDRATIIRFAEDIKQGTGGCSAVLPAASKAHAKQMVKAHKFLSMTREEQVEQLAWTLCYSECGDNPLLYSSNARAVLATIYGEAKP